MKVKELREKLEEFEDDYLVLIDIDIENTPCLNIDTVYEGSLWNIIIKTE